jgi:hypothetical protein
MARKQNRPMNFSRVGVCTARRPCHGPGLGFYFPTWADLGLVIASRSSGIDGCALLPADQNRHSGQNPSTHQSLPSLPLSLSCAAPQQVSDGRASDGRRTTAPPRPPRRRVCSLMGGRAAVERLGGPYPRVHPHGSGSDDSSSTCSDHSRLEHHRSSRFPSAQRRLGIYPHGVWIRPQPAIVVAEISTPR